MRKQLVIGIAAMVTMLSLSGCGKESTATPEGDKVMKEYSTVYTAEVDTLNYLKSTVSDSIALYYSLGDGLVEFDRFGQMIPCLATDWTISEDQLTYTFTLRPDVKWYTWDGKEAGTVKAQDFVSGIQWILNKDNAASTSKTVYDVIHNGEAYYNGEITDFSQVGVRAVDDQTVEYVLKEPVPYFLKQLSFPCFFPVNGEFLESQGEMFGVEKENILYCGAYLMTSFEPQSQRILEANPNYWNPDIISISRLTFRYNAEANSIGAELFSRGEINDFILPGSIVDEWMQDDSKKAMMYPNNLTNMSYFMGFNFDPDYEAEYKPEDWRIAVNNVNFRKSLFHGMDRTAAVLTMEPYNPESKLLNTFTRRNLVEAGGVDYTQMGGLKAYTDKDSFDKEQALSYKEKAMAELKDQVTFPIQIVMPFSTAKVDTANRMQVIAQQLENLLGTDYIKVVLQSYPGTGFSKQVRDPGKFSMMELGWGSDYADPLGMMNPVHSKSSADKYTRVHMAADLLNADGSSRFEQMLDDASKETKDLSKRYEMFAQAETLLLDQAIVIPFYTSGGGYRASYLDPFSGLTSQMGRNGAIKLKGAVILDEPLGMDRYEQAKAQYEADREQALTSAAQ